MGLAAFNRARRLAQERLKAKELTEVEQLKERVLTNKELKALLDEKGIEYDAKANKETLTKLLEGAE